MQKGFSAVFLLVGVLVIALIAGGAFYIGRNTVPAPQNDSIQKAQINQTSNPTPEASSKQPEPSSVSDETTGWKTYSNANYSFKYPADWTLSTSEYLNSVSLTNPNKTVSITISEGQYPYGYGGEVKFDKKDIKVMVSGKEYSVKENTTNDTEVFVDFKLDSTKDYHVLFGTGYPGGFGGKTSKEDYYNAKPTILQILSSFKFTS